MYKIIVSFQRNSALISSQVNKLRGEADKIESEMHQTRSEVEHQEKEIGRLRGQLRRMGSKDSLYVSEQNKIK